MVGQWRLVINPDNVEMFRHEPKWFGLGKRETHHITVEFDQYPLDEESKVSKILFRRLGMSYNVPPEKHERKVEPSSVLPLPDKLPSRHVLRWKDGEFKGLEEITYKLLGDPQKTWAEDLAPRDQKEMVEEILGHLSEEHGKSSGSRKQILGKVIAVLRTHPALSKSTRRVLARLP